MYNVITMQLTKTKMLPLSHSSREVAAVMMCVFGQGNIPSDLTMLERERVAAAVACLKLLDPDVVASVSCALLRYDSRLATQMLAMLTVETSLETS